MAPFTTLIRSLGLAALVALGVGGSMLWMDTAQEPEPPARPAASGKVEEPAPQAPAAALPGESTETVEAPEALAPARPKQSLGHQAGLHRVKDGLGLSASAAMIVDAETGGVLYEKNADAVLPIASLTKLMTALVLSQARVPLEDTVTITDEDVDRERNSRSRLRVGTTLTRAEALQLALMSSENRAAHALGRSFPGGLAAFVAAMNVKARQLGMAQTTFVDPTGLSVDNRSTARDLTRLAAAAAQDPLLRDYSTTPARLLVSGGRSLRYINSNRLVKNPQWDIQLQKTGYIIEAGQCLAMQVRIDGREHVLVVLDAGDKRSRLGDAERLRRWAARQADAPERQAGERHAAKA